MGGSLTSIVVIPRCNRGGAPTEAYRPPRDRRGSPLLYLCMALLCLYATANVT